jgi:hypothetical protein
MQFLDGIFFLWHYGPFSLALASILDGIPDSNYLFSYAWYSLC